MTEPTKIDAKPARRMLGELIDRAWDGEHIVIMRHGKAKAMLVGLKPAPASAPKRRKAP